MKPLMFILAGDSSVSAAATLRQTQAILEEHAPTQA